MPPAILASCRKRALDSGSADASSVRIFTTTSRSITVSRARYTCDIPPPRKSRSSYLPIMEGSCMGSNDPCQAQAEINHGHYQQRGEAAQKRQPALSSQRRREGLQKRWQFIPGRRFHRGFLGRWARLQRALLQSLLDGSANNPEPLRTLGRRLCHAFADQIDRGRRHIRFVQRLQIEWFVKDLMKDLFEILRLNGLLACQQLVEQHAKRVYVCLGGDILPQHLLGRHVIRSAQRKSGLSEPHSVRLGDAE